MPPINIDDHVSSQTENGQIVGLTVSELNTYPLLCSVQNEEKIEKNGKVSKKKVISIACLTIIGLIVTLFKSTISFTIFIALMDSFDFYTYALLLHILQKDKPINNFFAFLIPYFLGYWTMGIVYLYLGDVADVWMGYLTSPTAMLIFQIISIILVVVGSILLAKSLKQRNRGEIFDIDDKAVPDSKFKIMQAKIKSKYRNYSSLRYSLVAIFTIITYLPFAFPYLAFVTFMGGYQLPNFAMIVILLGYSCVFILPYFILLYFYRRYSEKFDAIFSRLFGRISKFFEQAIVKASFCLIFGVGLLLWLTLS